MGWLKPEKVETVPHKGIGNEMAGKAASNQLPCQNGVLLTIILADGRIQATPAYCRPVAYF
jgi:hypothetical protein